jgi:CBS domain-containing protein
MNVLVKDMMTTRVVAVMRDATFKDMASRLHRYRVSAFPVIDDGGRVIGVVSETDLITKEAVDLARDALGDTHLPGADSPTAADLMSSPPVTIGPDAPLENAARLMFNCRVKRLPVTDNGGRLMGIISRADVLAVFDRSDEGICHDVVEMMARDFPADHSQLAVTVQAGVVTLSGKPASASLGHEIVHKARHVPGVVGVRDRLSYPAQAL